jgi:sec-independent protein translocase protein TatC
MKLFNRNFGGDAKAEMSFFQHLDVLRGHLFKSAIAVTLGAILVAIYKNIIVHKILMGPTYPDFATYTFLCHLGSQLHIGDKLCLSPINIKMISTEVAGQFGVYFNIILIGGFVIAFPYVFWQFWKFVRPALTAKELSNTRGVIFWVSLLFFLGICFGYFVIAPYTINFFSNFSLDENIDNRWTIGSYFNTIVPLILGSGLAFQLPLVLFFLAKADVVSAKYLRKVRKYAYLIITILAGIVTPPDMLSQIICTVPLVILYEISILLCVKVEKKRNKENPPEWN